jgi:RNA polymerase sigma-70 factor (sigma-E family)
VTRVGPNGYTQRCGVTGCYQGALGLRDLLNVNTPDPVRLSGRRVTWWSAATHDASGPAAACNVLRADLVVAGVNPSDEQDFTEFVRAHADRLLRFARLLVPDSAEAEDLLQTALLRLTRHWSRRLDAPTAYVRATLVNLAKDRGRRSHLVPVPVRGDVDLLPARSDHAEAIAARAHLDQVLAALPPRQRVTVVLRVVDGLSEAETAALMRCSPGTVRSNLARGLDKVRTALESSLASAEETAK